MADMSKPKKTKTRPKTVDTLERYDCRWPIGDPRHADFHFCGAPQLPGRPYCELHWRMAFQPMKSRTPSLPSASSSRRAA
jgi:GcrA cell cycle regulator